MPGGEEVPAQVSLGYVQGPHRDVDLAEEDIIGDEGLMPNTHSGSWEGGRGGEKEGERGEGGKGGGGRGSGEGGEEGGGDSSRWLGL